MTKIYITTIDAMGNKINIWREQNHYLFEGVTKELKKDQIEILNNMFAPKNYHANWQQKIILLLCMLSLTNTNVITTLASDQIIISSNFTDNDIKDIIKKYNLKEKEYILKNQEHFFAYYNAVMTNKHFEDEDRSSALRNFYYVNEYLSYDFENQLKKIQNRNITIDDSICDQNDAEGLFFKGTDDIYLKNDVDEMVRDHENIHHLFDFKEMYEMEGLNLIEDQTIIQIYGSSFAEALASDLACESASKDGFTNTYRELNLCLQALYTTFSKDEMLKILSQPNYIELLYQELINCGLNINQIYPFFCKLDVLHAVSTRKYKIDNIDQTLLTISNDLIDIYEAKQHANWQESLKMKSIIYALNETCKWENLKETPITELSHFNEIESLVTQKNFLNAYEIDLSEGSISVTTESRNANWNGDLCLKINRGILEANDIDVSVYAFEGNQLIKQNSYNSVIYNCQKELEEAQIPESEWHYYIDNINFTTAFRYQINHTNFLDKKEKKYLIGQLPTFINLHSKLFKNISDNTVAQTLFVRAYQACTTKNEIFMLFCDEDLLYLKGGQDYLSTLKQDGYCDLKIQKELISNFHVYGAYRYALKNYQQNGNISEEEYLSLIWEYPNFLEKHPELIKLEEQAIYFILIDAWKNCLTFEELQTEIKKEEMNNIQDEKSSQLIRIPMTDIE